MAYIVPSTAEQKVQAGYLARCSPQAAYDWLHERAPKISAEARESRNLLNETPDLAEYILLRRNDRLIDLGIARFGYTERTVRRAYRRGDAACRIAAWSNVAARGSTLRSDIWAHEGDLDRLTSHGHEDELITMSANPALGENVLFSLVGRRGPFSGLTDKRWAACLVGLSRNPRLKEEYGPDRMMDGFAEHSHNRVFASVWGLASTLPARQEWAALLSRVLQDCRISYGMDKEAEALLERWRIDWPRKPDSKYYNPGPSFYLRTRLADLLKPDQALASQDRAVRLSFWQRFDPRQHPGWVEDMELVFEAEEELEAHDALTAAMRNERLWQSEEARETLSSLCWRAPDLRHDMMMPNVYRGLQRRRAEEHPEWFREVDAPAPTRSPQDAEPAWVSRLTERMECTSDGAEPAWAAGLAEKVDDLAGRARAPAAAPRSWWSVIPWWVWLVTGFFAARAVPMLH